MTDEEFALHLATCQASDKQIRGALMRRRSLCANDADAIIDALEEMLEAARDDGQAEACEILWLLLRGDERYRKMNGAQLTVLMSIAKSKLGHGLSTDEEIKQAIKELDQRQRKGPRLVG